MRSRPGPAAVRGESQRCRVARSWTRDAFRMMHPGPVRVVRPVRPGPPWRNPGHAPLGAPLPSFFRGKAKERKSGVPAPKQRTGADTACLPTTVRRERSMERDGEHGETADAGADEANSSAYSHPLVGPCGRRKALRFHGPDGGGAGAPRLDINPLKHHMKFAVMEVRFGVAEAR